MRYRSFGNEAVRNPVAPQPAAPTEEQAFSVLGDALSGLESLPPDTVMMETAPVPTEAPMLPVRDSYPTYPTSYTDPKPVAPDPYAVLDRAPPPPAPPATIPPISVAPPQPVAVLPAVPPAAMVPPVTTPLPPIQQPAPPRAPVPTVPPAPVAAPEPPGSSLLQVLLGGPVQPQPAPPRAAPLPPVAAPLPLPPTPVLPVAAVPVQPAADIAPRPVVPQAAPPPMPMLAALPAANWPPAGFAGSTGSSLLDTLMGVGAGPSAGTIHYPLLDALGDAMRGSAADPSPRHWPAARVDIALPELLRRIAAGVRFARTAA